jgi:hypothetical protein
MRIALPSIRLDFCIGRLYDSGVNLETKHPFVNLPSALVARKVFRPRWHT